MYFLLLPDSFSLASKLLAAYLSLELLLAGTSCLLGVASGFDAESFAGFLESLAVEVFLGSDSPRMSSSS